MRQPIHTRNAGGWRRYAGGMAPVQELFLAGAHDGASSSPGHA
jgi:hypothetical protein